MTKKYTIHIKYSDPQFKLKKAYPYDSGYDLKANIDNPITLEKGERATIKTGIFLQLPNKIEAQIRPRSGLASNLGLTVLNSPGTIDSNYRGEIKVILINLGSENITINKLGKIAQIVFQEKTYIVLEIADFISDNTTRGLKELGSSDTNH